MPGLSNKSGAARPGFNSLIPVASVPSLVSTEPVGLFCRAGNISPKDPFCFAKQKQETVQDFLPFLFTNRLHSRMCETLESNEYGPDWIRVHQTQHSCNCLIDLMRLEK